MKKCFTNFSWTQSEIVYLTDPHSLPVYDANSFLKPPLTPSRKSLNPFLSVYHTFMFYKQESREIYMDTYKHSSKCYNTRTTMVNKIYKDVVIRATAIMKTIIKLSGASAFHLKHENILNFKKKSITCTSINGMTYCRSLWFCRTYFRVVRTMMYLFESLFIAYE